MSLRPSTPRPQDPPVCLPPNGPPTHLTGDPEILGPWEGPACGQGPWRALGWGSKSDASLGGAAAALLLRSPPPPAVSLMDEAIAHRLASHSSRWHLILHKWEMDADSQIKTRTDSLGSPCWHDGRAGRVAWWVEVTTADGTARSRPLVL